MKLKLLVATLLLVLLSGCSDDKASQSSQNTAEPKNETIALAEIDGTPVEARLTGEGRVKDFHFSSAEGKAVVAVYWATDCPACKAEIPHLIKLQDKYQESLKIIGVLVQDIDKEDVEEFIAYHGINYDTLYGEANYDLADAMGGVRGIPAMFLFKKDGSLYKNFVGLLPPEMLEAEIKKII